MTCGIPQGSVLGPCLFSLYTNDMPASVVSGTLYLYANDSTIYSVGSTVDEACSLLNKALDELNKWCMANSLTPHSTKCEAMLFYRGSFTGPYPVITVGNEAISWVCYARLLGVTIDHKLTWTKHLTELKNNFVNKLNLLRKCTFLTRKPLLDLYFTLWGNCNNCDHIKSLQALHCRAGRIIFNLPWDTPSETVMEVTQWDSVYEMYKLCLL